MTTTLTPPLPASSPDRRDAGTRSSARAAPGLAVLALPLGRIPIAGYLLRHGPALALAETPPDPVPVSAAAVGVWVLPSELERLEEARGAAAERALEATVNAGFELHAVETLTREQLRGRLRSLRDAGAACVVVADRGAGEGRRLARAAGAPVLVLPRDAAPAGGPAVLDAEEARHTAPAAARALATEQAVVVAGSPLAPSGGPALDPASGELAHRLRRRQLDAAAQRAGRAALVAAEHGLRAATAVSLEPRGALGIAAAHEGILVLADAGGWRGPRLLRPALAARRPVLLVPVPEAVSRAHRKYSGRLT